MKKRLRLYFLTTVFMALIFFTVCFITNKTRIETDDPYGTREEAGSSFMASSVSTNGIPGEYAKDVYVSTGSVTINTDLADPYMDITEKLVNMLKFSKKSKDVYFIADASSPNDASFIIRIGTKEGIDASYGYTELHPVIDKVNGFEIKGYAVEELDKIEIPPTGYSFSLYEMTEEDTGLVKLYAYIFTEDPIEIEVTMREYTRAGAVYHLMNMFKEEEK